jgi:internalin A
MSHSRKKPAAISPAATGPTADAPDTERFVYPFNDSLLIAYYRQLFDWHGYIRFLGLPHLQDNPDIPLWELYVEPRLAEVHVRPELPTVQWPASTSVREALQSHQRLAVLGDPGSGKSTLVNWLVWQFTQVDDGELTHALGRLVPVPLILRDLQIGPDITWQRLLEAFLARPVAEAFGGEVARLKPYLETGQALLLVDGMDEIGDPQTRRHLRRALEGGFREFPRCRWLLTSRIVGYEDVIPEDTGPPLPTADAEQLSQAIGKQAGRRGADDLSKWLTVTAAALSTQHPLAVCYVCPFDDDQIILFVHHWFATREPVRSEAKTLAERFLTAVRGNAATQQLARVPNLLTMLTLIYRVLRELPYGRKHLYDRITEAYLHSIDQARGLRENDFELEEKKQWLQYIGFQMQRRRRGEADDKKAGARDILVDRAAVESWLLTAMRRTRPQTRPEEAADYLNYLARRSGLLLPRGEGQFAFMHLSFQEYFAAAYLVEQILAPDWQAGTDVAEGARLEDLRRNVELPGWRETFVQLFEMLAKYPRWPDRLADQLLGGRPAPADRPAEDPLADFHLLAELSVDPYTGLSEARRRKAWQDCWQGELADQQARDPAGKRGSTVCPILLGAPPAYAAAVRAAFTQAAKAPTIKTLRLTGRGASRELALLRGLDHLESLVVEPCDDLTGLDEFLPVKQLQLLILRGCRNLVDLEALRPFRRLDALSINDASQLADISPLADVHTLEILMIQGSPLLTDLTPLKGLTSLIGLILGQCSSLQSLEPLRPLRNLRNIFLAGCRSLTDLSPLQDLRKLNAINIVGCKGITDLSPVKHAKEIKGP